MEYTIQMNVRMNRDLKKTGDESLALIGLGPSQAVRALWEKASRRGKDLEEIANLLAPAASDGAAFKLDGDNPAVRGWAMMDEALRSLGIDADEPWGPVDDDEMLAEALLERMAERGLA